MPNATYERSDANTRAIWITAGVIVVVLALILLLMHDLLSLLNHLDRPLHTPRTAVTTPASTPDPRLQGLPSFHATTPRQDMVAYLAIQQRVLTTYAPTTQPGYARIPISRAIDLMVTTTAQHEGGTDEKD